MSDEETKAGEPVDHGDGKPAVSLPAGSVDGDALAAALEEVDHEDGQALAKAVKDCVVGPDHSQGVTMVEAGSNGYYEIQAPWMSEPLKVRGKAKAEAERDRIVAEGPPEPEAENPNPDPDPVPGPEGNGEGANTNDAGNEGE